MSALLEVTGVTKRYPGVVANDNVSLTVNAGEVVALLGENGAGKSTLLKAVFGLIKPDSGTIKVFGQNIPDLNREELDKIKTKENEK